MEKGTSSLRHDVVKRSSWQSPFHFRASLIRFARLTNLYDERPAWLDTVHRELDAAVAAAHGWPADLSVDAILKRLVDLNLARAAAQAGS
jgi:hypothetical protein